MLPEELCNDKCSLRPGEDKLCMSVVFTMDADARVLKYKICRTVIRSDLRLNYDEAQSIISSPNPESSSTASLSAPDSPSTTSLSAPQSPSTTSLSAPQSPSAIPPSDPISISYDSASKHVLDTYSTRTRDVLDTKTDRCYTEVLSEAIHTLNDLASKLRAERIANGALTIEQDEMRFRLDEKGQPVEIYFEQPNEAHHLIEEFMLLANRTVAKAVGSGRPFVYRVHDLPDGEKLDEVKAFKRKMGSRVSQQTIDLLTIRAQAKAVYSTYNIGHYGLAFTHYTHFTSPIRRYPDLMVHRLVEKYILTGKKETMTREELELMCEHCSACEQEAAQAERESVKMFQTLWMESHVGEIFAGHISGVTEFGLFVQLDESRCEGLVHISNIGFPGENWLHDPQNYRLVCAENGIAHTLGDPVRVKVVRVDINRALIDFEFA
jgi:exoribonuclease R